VSIRGPSSLGASPELVGRAITQSNGRPIVAEDVFAEQVAAAGGKILVGNPIDAFSRHEQDLYLDWTAGKHAGLLAIAPSVSVALTSRDSAAERLMRRDPAFRVTADDGRALLFTRVRGSGRRRLVTATAQAPGWVGRHPSGLLGLVPRPHARLSG
jgi:hypothetical protein